MDSWSSRWADVRDAAVDNRVNLSAVFTLAVALAWRNPVQGALTLAFLMLYSYWVHRLSHTKPFSDLPFLRLHRVLHHSELNETLRTESLVFEVMSNIFLVGGLALLALPGALHVLHPTVTLFYALVFTSTHIIDLHRECARNGYHASHHKDYMTNMSPSIMDAAFGTGVLTESRGNREEDVRVSTLVGCAVVAWAVTWAVTLAIDRIDCPLVQVWQKWSKLSANNGFVSSIRSMVKAPRTYATPS
jgi:sterol desaturase/sphingolipid hydroxylase (fatty acid hydroxylase superfamily)